LKITPSANKPVADALPAARTANASAAQAGAAGKGAVDLSPTARLLAGLQNADDDIDVERVQQIRDAIASGQLKIDSSRIADSLLASVREMLKKP